MQHFEHRHAACVAGPGAAFTALRIVKLLSSQYKTGWKACWNRFVGFFALLAEFSDQALGDDHDEGGADKERFYADIHQTTHSRGRIVGMDSAEYQMACERRAHADLGRLQVTCFTDQHDIGVLTKEGAQTRGECEAD